MASVLSSLSTEHAFYNATRNELKHNYDKPRERNSETASYSSGTGSATAGEVRYNNAAKHGDSESTNRKESTPRPETNLTPTGSRPESAGESSTPKLKIKSNIIDTTSKPKLLKIADPEQIPPMPAALFHHPFPPGMNPMLPPGLEPHHPMEEVHPYLWHPLFGK
ncbi:hypothetical protein WDU94_003003 [Cyamophila willieti]